MARKVFLDYVWKYCLEPQLGYSFSINHTLPYSIVAVQEANLATRWDPLYWQCACLCVNAGNYVGDIGDDGDEPANETEDVITEDAEGEEKRGAKSAPNYGKIAKAIADAQLSGVQIGLPDINEAQIDFVPDTKNRKILYSIQAVNVVGADLLARILGNRPYLGIKDFITKVAPTTAQMIGLIKAGSFDRLCGKPRQQIMQQYLQYLADEEFPLKDKLTSVQIKKALELGIDLPDFRTEIRIFRFRQYITKHQLNAAEKRYVLNEEACLKFFNGFIAPHMNLSKSEYEYLPGGAIGIKQTVFERVHNKLIAKLVEYMNTEDGRRAFQNLVQTDFINTLREKYCQGSISKWEFDTMSFYYSGHELAHLNRGIYNVQDFNTLPETSASKELCAIAGTVTDTNNIRHTVSVLTTSGVVDVKFYAGAYAQFNQKISAIDSDTKKKTTIDDSWFKRGNKLLIYGQRRENMFCCKALREPGRAPRFVGLIENIRADGTLDVRYQRKKG